MKQGMDSKHIQVYYKSVVLKGHQYLLFIIVVACCCVVVILVQEVGYVGILYVQAMKAYSQANLKAIIHIATCCIQLK